MRVNDQPTFPNNSALGRATRVTMSAGYLVAAGATTDEFGTLQDSVLSTDTYASVLPLGYFGVREYIANAAISQYATVWAASSGKVSSTPGTLRRGIALEAASGDGSIIRVLMQAGSGSPV